MRVVIFIIMRKQPGQGGARQLRVQSQQLYDTLVVLLGLSVGLRAHVSSRLRHAVDARVLGRLATPVQMIRRTQMLQNGGKYTGHAGFDNHVRSQK